KWQTRTREVQDLVDLLTRLRSRFAPIAVREEDLKKYGLDQPAVLVKVCAGTKDYQLAFGEAEVKIQPPDQESEVKEKAGDEAEAGEGNRFSRPTYLRLDENREVVRLAPGLIAALGRPPDYYQQRRLFPFERVAKEEGSSEKVEQLAAKAIAVAETKKDGTTYALKRVG